MSSEKKIQNGNQRNSKRKIEKTKQNIKANVEENTSHHDTLSENCERKLSEIFDKCIEIRDNSPDDIGEAHPKDKLRYENFENNDKKSPIFNIVEEHLNLSDVNCSTINSLITTNSRETNKITESNDKDNIFLESNNHRQEVINGLQNERECLTNEMTLIKTSAQLSYTNGLDINNIKIEYKEYESEVQMQDIMKLIQAELSEPYSIYTYRYFIYNWPKLCFLAMHGNKYVGAIVCKLDMHMNIVKRGYIAMLAVKKEYRKLKIGTNLVQKAIDAMLADNADEVVLETEMKNVSALRLYENLGFVRDKRLFRYYLNGVDALRLKLWFN